MATVAFPLNDSLLQPVLTYNCMGEHASDISKKSWKKIHVPKLCLMWLLLSEVQYSQMDWRMQTALTCLQTSWAILSWGIQCSIKNFSAFSFVLYKRTSPRPVQFLDSVWDPALQQVCFVLILEREWPSCEEVAIPTYLRSTKYSMNPSHCMSSGPPNSPTRCVHFFGRQIWLWAMKEEYPHC